ncbi:MAG: hypothetical protein P9M14_13555 [Candidatus Alcyoniella australis]|nr:hypothetical protein [Candidatus Alcyoniella australis]
MKHFWLIAILGLICCIAACALSGSDDDDDDTDGGDDDDDTDDALAGEWSCETLQNGKEWTAHDWTITFDGCEPAGSVLICQTETNDGGTAVRFYPGYHNAGHGTLSYISLLTDVQGGLLYRCTRVD